MGCCFSGNKTGEQRDIDGPRQCTDIVPLVVFTGFWGVMIFITSYAVGHGNLWRLINGADSFGNTCGRENLPINGLNISGRDMRGRPFLHSMDIRDPFKSVWICVQNCPKFNMDANVDFHSYRNGSGVELCLYDTVDYLDEVTNPRTTVGPCPLVVFNSTPVINRCVPTNLDVVFLHTEEKFILNYFGGIDYWEKFVWDLKELWQPILLACLVAFVGSSLLVALLRFCGGLIIYVLMVIIIVGVLGVAAAMWTYYGLVVHDIPNEIVDRLRQLTHYANDKDILLGLSIGTSILAGIVVILVSCMISRAKMLAELFQLSGRFLQSSPCILLQPVITFACLMTFVAGWILVLFLIVSSNEENIVSLASTGPVQLLFKGVQFNRSSTIHLFTAIHFFGLAWITEFIYACEQMLIAGAVAKWYFSKDKEVAVGYMCASLKCLVVYHLGTVALGSLIITLVKIPRWIIMFLSKRISNSKLPCSMRLVACCQGCLLCIEKCLKYIHRNAYTITAIEGSSFCPAAVQAFGILASHPISVGTIKGLGGCILYLGKIGVVAGAVVVGSLFFQQIEGLHSRIVPLLLIALLAYLIADCFFTVYSTVIDTLFLCYCEDSAMQVDNGDEQMKSAVTSQMDEFVRIYGKRRFENESSVKNDVELEEVVRL